MRTLYPDIHPYKDHAIQVDETHTLYVEESGNAEGIPVVFVHGGPGSGTNPACRSFFNPELYRIILFDQRGAGLSKPHASLENNTTQDLISDMEAIRHALGVDEWLVFGGSWGATLSLLYAQAFPERVSGLILRGVFLGREQDIHWLYQEGASRIFPDHWQGFLKPIPDDQHEDLLAAYYQQLTSKNELERMAAAKAWSLWEGQCSTLLPHQEVTSNYTDPHLALSMARIEAHYFVNKNFIEPNQIINDAHKIQDIPTTIVHGRYDMVCPLEQAYDLYEALPNSELHIVRNAGHSSFEKSTIDNLVKATDEFAQKRA